MTRKTTLTLSPRDPLISRDGRPFGEGARMRSLNWLRPSVTTGSLRTLLGKLDGRAFDEATIAELKQLSLVGPFPMVDGRLYLPAPKDILIEAAPGQTPKHHRLEPGQLEESEGTTLPDDLDPVLMDTEEAFKPVAMPAFWSVDKIAEWLCQPGQFGLPDFDEKSSKRFLGTDFLHGPEKEERTHVKLEPGTGTAAEGMLFSTTGLDMKARFLDKPEGTEEGTIPYFRPLDLALGVSGPENSITARLAGLDAIHPCGGERRLVRWQSTDPGKIWDCPQIIRKSLNESGNLVRMILASPAVFEKGWLPAWLSATDAGLQGTIPETGITVRLRAVVNDRWEPLSGWSYEHQSPKPISRMVPAGSVYFFEITGGNPEELAEHWLKPVSDDLQIGRDGFGLALWGPWSPGRT